MITNTILPIAVMNCIWIHRKARGHNFERLLLADMTKDERKPAVLPQ
ncbi:MAG: hypothetical protein NDF54_03500 [archaeon GB-1867-035]|nr:hypothetical protein [Candidatus Culexmicrobium profundum]